MGTAGIQTESEEGWLMDILSDCLKIPKGHIEPTIPLTQYGLDSLGAIQLTTEISERINCEVPVSILSQHPSAKSLREFLADAKREDSDSWKLDTGNKAVAKMLADSVLPDDIHCTSADRDVRPAQAILLTGATGFLGAYLLKSLIKKTNAQIHCLVRNNAGHGERIQSNLSRYGLWQETYASRIQEVAGDLDQEYLGLTAEEFDNLASVVDEIYHCGANVNWVIPYDSLRDTNVLGTRELLKLACRTKAKPFHFVSTLAMCYTSENIGSISENDSLIDHLELIHLGYAQSKCVAEELIRQASQRGIRATIHRPALIMGDSTNGVANAEDLLYSMLRGCIQMGSAPDIDWMLDCLPVDFTADSIVELSQNSADQVGVFHLANPVSRRWREIVLWLNLYGYELEMVPYRQWLAKLRIAALYPDHPLHRLTSFFLRQPIRNSTVTLPELFEQGRGHNISHERTIGQQANLELTCPSFDASTLEKTFEYLIDTKNAPPTDFPSQRSLHSGVNFDEEFFQNLIRAKGFETGSKNVSSVVEICDEASDSITTELASWRHGSTARLAKFDLRFDKPHESMPVFVKVKNEDADLIRAATTVARLCNSDLGSAVSRNQQALDYVGCHRRELNVYQQLNERFRQIVPQFYGAFECDSSNEWVLILESISDLEHVNSGDASNWRQVHYEASIRGIARIHAGWFQQNDDAENLGIVRRKTPLEMTEMSDLWQAYAKHSRSFFVEWTMLASNKLSTDWFPILASGGRNWRVCPTL